MNEDLRQSLSGIADDVHFVDLHARALGRSRQIRRNRITAVTASALAVLGLAGFGVANLDAFRTRPGPPAVVAASVSPSPGATVRKPAPSGPATVTMAVPASKSLTALTGELFYRSKSGTVVRFTGDGTRTTVLDRANQAVAISPDGRQVAYVSAGKLRLAGAAQPLLSGTVDIAKQLPSWSPDGTRLLVAAPSPAVLTVATGKLGPIPGGLKGQNFHWSGDGSKLFYTAGQRIRVGAATVPVFGDPDVGRNPEQLSGDLVLSVDRTGARFALRLSNSFDVDQRPDTVADASTGALDPIPVPGTVESALFDTDGNLMVRATDGDRRVLSLFSATGTLLVQATEPASLRDLDLIAYTR
ncbi:hypothetical protein ACWT_0909 [Actinoplanes sp. SE50]|uniref:PD40 domain-containing protein n=1 Tax=unclassified Actinoplanes TaxID=2626549 RepID=UPI00023EC571|nr:MULTISPECIES: PD40 domain-containing protein [unclassified Actinoplanes]AEV81924.1 hypothetical protein ACPL_1027 [Actinoplanes sp. SE50/110]ATO80324.1 hypothetical protein ACWT_0909 [Actinoplanes sp. SE50]SLL97729.1 hypothetical protein ACSP50_0938 [Actinoplanes sp. SE50/110]